MDLVLFRELTGMDLEENRSGGRVLLALSRRYPSCGFGLAKIVPRSI